MQQENALKTVLPLSVCEFCFCVSLLETLCSIFFHSCSVCCCCQLADSCFIILFQKLNPKKCVEKRVEEVKNSAYYCTRASPLQPLVPSEVGGVGSE